MNTKAILAQNKLKVLLFSSLIAHFLKRPVVVASLKEDLVALKVALKPKFIFSHVY